MLALDPTVFEPVWVTAQSLIPPVEDRHPLGCHRPRVPDRSCFFGIVARLVTGCSWDVAARFVGVGGVLGGSAVASTTVKFWSSWTSELALAVAERVTSSFGAVFVPTDFGFGDPALSGVGERRTGGLLEFGAGEIGWKGGVRWLCKRSGRYLTGEH